ncbi:MULTISPECIES: hypothetical protein [Flavobacteriaceae]|uniref:hypothetical protein n=1 Tax=Flavobacteriaceae TaxID=49546 RepID=UPI0014919949|nr:MULTISPECIES: hypothetical protein [Allomuricauda]MDC6366687.1 hypothetical protein [Muricauda sp. AC10]
MNVKIFIGFVLLCLLTNSCKNKSDNVNSETGVAGNQEVKNISELTFRDILFLLHKENEFGADYHGESFGQEALGDIVLEAMTKTDCGEEMALVNTSSEWQIQTAVMATFDFPNNPVKEIAMVHMIAPGDTLPVGRNILCYNGERYMITRKVLSAGYVTEN